jgi:hypothetical protein
VIVLYNKGFFFPMADLSFREIRRSIVTPGFRAVARPVSNTPGGRNLYPRTSYMRLPADGSRRASCVVCGLKGVWA